MNRLILLAVALPVVAFAHPHNSPFTFIRHTMGDGHPVYTNIPQQCFKDGIMTCWKYHPVAGNRGSLQALPASKDSNVRMKKPTRPDRE